MRAVKAFQHVRRDADIRNHHVAGVRLARRQHERQLGRRQRHRHRGVDAVADQVWRVGGHAARQVDRDNRDPRRVDVGDDGLHHSAERRLQTGTEDRIDDQGALRDLRKVQLPCLLVADLDDGDAETAEDVEIGAGIAADVGNRADDEDRGIDAALDQRPRHDESVAAVVAASAQHTDASVEPCFVRGLHRRDDLPARVLHQHQRRYSDFFDGVAIGLAHLRGSEDPHHG